jgi:predicted amidohydrolase
MAAIMRFKAAAVHAAPVYMNKAATIRKTVGFIEQAAAKDIKLLVFPETFVPGYPVQHMPPHACMSQKRC